VADEQHRLIFTTFKAVNPAMRQMNAKFYFWAHLADMFSNVLLMSEEEESCAMLWEIGVPCIWGIISMQIYEKSASMQINQVSSAHTDLQVVICAYLHFVGVAADLRIRIALQKSTLCAPADLRTSAG